MSQSVLTDHNTTTIISDQRMGNDDLQRSHQQCNVIQTMNYSTFDELSNLTSGENAFPNISYTSLMEQIISSQPTISDMQDDILRQSNYVASPTTFQNSMIITTNRTDDSNVDFEYDAMNEDDENLEDNAMDNWSMDIFNFRIVENIFLAKLCLNAGTYFCGQY
uniref:Uncharacterized protein n=1 Tax=Oryza punctata TaxID=4537 RepID=A0A0E0JG51_ORYPU